MADIPLTQGPSGRLSQSYVIPAASSTAVDNKDTSAPVSAHAYEGIWLEFKKISCFYKASFRGGLIPCTTLA